METPEHNNLDDLLKKSDAGSLDDFEREALEGFDSLESKQEARELQNKVDKRIENELFQKKKHRLAAWWYAAAGICLVVGFSVFFTLNKSSFESKPDVAAIDESKREITNAPAEIQNHLRVPEADAKPEVNNMETPAEGKQANTLQEKELNARTTTKSGKLDESNYKEDQQKPISKDGYFVTVHDKNGVVGPETKSETQGKTADEAEKAADDFKMAEESDHNANAKGNAESTSDLNKIIAPAKKAEPEDQRNNRRKDESGGKSRFKKSAAPARAEESKASEVAQNNDGDLAEPALDRVSKEQNEALKQKTEEKKKEKNSDRESDNKDAADKQVATTKNNQNRIDNPSQPGFSGTVNNATNGAVVVNTQPISNTASGGATYSWTYEGGDASLKKELTEKLKAIGLNKKFDATLNINEKNKVEKVKFDNAYGLDKEQLAKIENVLKSLSKFSGGMSQTGYTLLYRP